MKNKYDDGHEHYKCPDCGFWSTHPLDNHRCFKPNILPKKIIRIDDGMEFLLNPKTKKYYVHLGIPHLDEAPQIRMEYSFDRLMRHPDLFKISDGTEDIQAMKKAWLNHVNEDFAANRGCGD